MLLLHLARLRRGVAEDHVHLVGASASVGAEHQRVRRVPVQRVGFERLLVGVQELEVRAAALQALLQRGFVLHDQTRAGVEGLRQQRRDSVVARLGVHEQTLVLGVLRGGHDGDTCACEERARGRSVVPSTVSAASAVVAPNASGKSKKRIVGKRARRPEGETSGPNEKCLDVSRRISAGWGRALASVTRSRRNRYAICSFGRPHRRDESVRLRLSFRARARTVVLVVLRSGPRSEAIGEGGQKRDVARDHGLDEGMRLHGVRRRSGGRDGHTGHEELVAHAGRNEARRMRRVS